jgi:hypothetical protein
MAEPKKSAEAIKKDLAALQQKTGVSVRYMVSKENKTGPYVCNVINKKDGTVLATARHESANDVVKNAKLAVLQSLEKSVMNTNLQAKTPKKNAVGVAAVKVKHQPTDSNIAEANFSENGSLEVNGLRDLETLEQLSSHQTARATTLAASPVEDQSLGSILRTSTPTNNGCIPAVGFSLVGSHSYEFIQERGLLGSMNSDGENGDRHVYLNVHDPFCFVAVGVQGSGKSHTVNVVLENMLLSSPPEIKLDRPIKTLVFHYDSSPSSVCEAIGLIRPSSVLKSILGESCNIPHLDAQSVIVLVSPSFYRQRKAFYGNACTVIPLLFEWERLTADQIKILLRVGDGDQLYVAVLLDMLRSYQRDARVPPFNAFMKQIIDAMPKESQSGPLKQRLSLLESLVAESDFNKSLLQTTGNARLSQIFETGKLIIADLSDPLLSAGEANSIFHVLLTQFRALPFKHGGKAVLVDEAHKFLQAGGDDGLTSAIVDAARLMRHEGMRLVVSTQSPKVLAPELLELVTIAAIHRFHSVDWFTHLANKIPLDSKFFPQIQNLFVGEAIVFCPKMNVITSNANNEEELIGPGNSPVIRKQTDIIKLVMRQRVTLDYGASRTNNISS